MGFALELSPPPRSIDLLKIRQIANAGPDSDYFDPFDLVKDFKFHSLLVPLANLTHMSHDICASVSLVPIVPCSLKGKR
jgi:hypothetical protein